MVAEHVEHAHLRQADGVEVGTLHLAGTHQQTAVRTAVDGQTLRRGILLGDEPLGRRDEVVEDVLLVLEHAGLVPGLAVLRAPAQVGHAVDTALLDEHHRRGVEARREVNLEAAVAVEQAGVLAVELQVLAMGDEHRDLRAVLRGVEDLLGDVERGVEGHLGGLVEGRLARGDVVAVERCGRGVVRERVVELRILLFTREAAHGADGRELHFAQELAVVVVLRDAVLGILQVGGPEVAARRADTLEQVLLMLGNHRLDLRGVVERDALEGVVQSTVVGHEVEVVLPAVDGRIVVGKALEQRAELLLGALAAEHLGARRTLRADDEEPLAVLRGPGREVAQRMLAVLVDEAVGRLGLAQLVVVDLLELVLRRVDTLLRGVVGAVIEALRIGRPGGAGELHPVDAVVGQLSRRGIHHTDFDPVRARRRGGIGHVAAILREGNRRQRHRTVLREGVGVEKDLPGLAGLLRAVDDRLILQSVVVGVVPPVAVLDGSRLLGIVPQLGEPLADGSAEGYLREVVLRHGILGRNPGGRSLRIVVLEPAVGVGNLHAEIVVHHVAALGGRIG